jgi:hypothetical protein
VAFRGPERHGGRSLQGRYPEVILHHVLSLPVEPLLQHVQRRRPAAAADGRGERDALRTTFDAVLGVSAGMGPRHEWGNAAGSISGGWQS